MGADGADGGGVPRGTPDDSPTTAGSRAEQVEALEQLGQLELVDGGGAALLPSAPRRLPDAVAPWLTKAEAAKVVGVNERTIERLAKAGRIGSQQRPGFPTTYAPGDVENEAEARRLGVRGVLLAPGATPGHPPADDSQAGALATRGPATALELLLVQVLQAAQTALAATPATPATTVSTPPPAYLTLEAALARSGISRAELRKAVAAGDVKMRGQRYRRADVEAL